VKKRGERLFKARSDLGVGVSLLSSFFHSVSLSLTNRGERIASVTGVMGVYNSICSLHDGNLSGN